jgi:hypothetical protein
MEADMAKGPFDYSFLKPPEKTANKPAFSLPIDKFLNDLSLFF